MWYKVPSELGYSKWNTFALEADNSLLIEMMEADTS